jgi:hypothetical protein
MILCCYVVLLIVQRIVLCTCFQHEPNDTMRRIETFLRLPHFSYPKSVLQSVSENANLLPTFAFDSEEGKKAAAASSSHNFSEAEEHVSDNASFTSLTESRHDIEEEVKIHRPYSFEDKPLLYRLSKELFDPSLCLFEKAFGWKVRIITDSEL